VDKFQTMSRIAQGLTRSFDPVISPILHYIVALIRQVLYYVCITDMQKTHTQTPCLILRTDNLSHVTECRTPCCLGGGR